MIRRLRVLVPVLRAVAREDAERGEDSDLSRSLTYCDVDLL
jgi:hypothetical protein